MGIVLGVPVLLWGHIMTLFFSCPEVLCERDAFTLFLFLLSPVAAVLVASQDDPSNTVNESLLFPVFLWFPLLVIVLFCVFMYEGWPPRIFLLLGEVQVRLFLFFLDFQASTPPLQVSVCFFSTVSPAYQFCDNKNLRYFWRIEIRKTNYLFHNMVRLVPTPL